ncbi:hypothetical protein HPB47_009347 [Ixodes persulcatus]|uniref:Uncharacterized protein n=1 Tax=Ixodes persulcatus TaxID=34615 RepID=A0AC60P259_IXOPE|nr:hypothetical protein HPB47_009347 [Ixodes persulcatus]
MGSDHLPIQIELAAERNPDARRQSEFIKWDKFRQAFSYLANDGELGFRIMEAPRNLHLLNLWASRLQAQQQYRKNKKDWRFRIKFSEATAKAKRYTNQLKRSRWRKHCDGFNTKGGPTKMWWTFRAFTGDKKAKCTAQNLALKLGITERKLAEIASDQFFPQSQNLKDIPTDRPEYHDKMDMDAPFNMGELLEALHAAKNFTPGPGHITVAALRNLPEVGIKRAVTSAHQRSTRATGRIPAGGKYSTVIPIPKAGKPTDSIQNLRPIFLTFHLCKITERRILARITWQQEYKKQADGEEPAFP